MSKIKNRVPPRTKNSDVSQSANDNSKIKNRVPPRTKKSDTSHSANENLRNGDSKRWNNEVEERDSEEPAGEQTKLIEKHASNITTHWYRSTKAVWDTAVACAAAAKQLDSLQRKMLVEKLPFGTETFSKFIQIGKDQRLLKHLKHLPPSYSTIHIVSGLSDERLEEGIETGIIHSEATRIDIEEFRDGERKAPKTNARSEPEEGRRRAGAASKRDAYLGDVVENGDDSFEDDQEALEDEQELLFEDDEETSAPSAESVARYDVLVEQWQDMGLSRKKWQATPEKLREKFIEEVLRPEPLEQPVTATKPMW